MIRWTSGVSYSNVFTDKVQNEGHRKLSNKKTTNTNELGGCCLSVNCPPQARVFGHTHSPQMVELVWEAVHIQEMQPTRLRQAIQGQACKAVLPLPPGKFSASWLMPQEELQLQVRSYKDQAAFCLLQHDGCCPKTMSHRILSPHSHTANCSSVR